MVRLRIHTQEDDIVTRPLQLKSKLHNDAFHKLTCDSPSLADNGSPRRQRALKKVENNTVLLGSAQSFDDVVPSKFARSEAKSKSKVSRSIAVTTGKQAEPETPTRNASLKISRRRPVIDSDSESDTDIADILANKLTLHDGTIPGPTQSQRPHPRRKSSVDLQGALVTQGFEFASQQEEAAIAPVVDLCSSRPTTASGIDAGALLSFEPPKSRSPVKLPPERPSTPTEQLSPSKIKLRSPTKKIRVPESPHKSTSHQFWCPSAVNDWIDQHSPEKAIKSPSKSRLVAAFETEAIPFSPLKSTSSPSKAQKQAKKDFDVRKHQIASDFLAELDKDIMQDRIAELSKSAGGVQLIWSNKLNSTAGRAHWRRQETRIRHSDGTTSVEVKHVASIELAEKILDDETKLINTLAHEFCHLATFMIDGVKTNPHGKEFKAWAQKCSSRYSDRGVNVTTKHSYDIDYKYVWECTSCSTEYKRHSKSVNPARHRCGACKAALVQIRPVPRKNATVSDYQLFVKENFQRVKNLDKSASHGSVMETLGRLYREQKASASPQKQDASPHSAVDELVEEVQAIDLTG